MNKIPMLERFAAQSLVEHDGELIFSKERFAELIVQECADIALKSSNVANKNIAAKIESERIYHKIREHFGVDE